MSAARQDQEIQVRRRLPRFGQVPDAILEDKSMSLETRAVLGYLVGRSDGFSTAVGRLCFVLGIKDARWRRIRREMEAAGYFLQIKDRRADGTYFWRNEVYDSPTIPPKPTDGKPTRGKAIRGKPTPLPEGTHQTDITTESREARAPRASANAQSASASLPPSVLEEKESDRETQPLKPAGKSLPAGRFFLTPAGITHEPGNELDQENLERISRHDPAAVDAAIKSAARQDRRGRAFASAVIKILDAQVPHTTPAPLSPWAIEAEAARHRPPKGMLQKEKNECAQ